MTRETTFSIGAIAPAIIVPLRYYFSRYTSGANLIWNADEKLRTLEIFEAYDANRVTLGEKPRVVVSRGGFTVQGIGISNNLADGLSVGENRGNRADTNMVIYEGSATVWVEARTKGACELLADMVTHFIGWAQPILCDTQGWKKFGLPLSVSDCGLVDNEDPNQVKFQVQINVPWLKEERWLVRTDGPELKKILLNLSNAGLGS